MKTLLRLAFAVPLIALALAVGTAWIRGATGETEGQMRAFLTEYAVFQRTEHAERGSHVRTVAERMSIPIGLEVLVLHASPEAHAAIVRHRMAIPRLYCALWVGPQPLPGPPSPDLTTPIFQSRCAEPELFEEWIAATRRARLPQ